MDIEVSFPGGKRVDARLGTHVIHTDQPAALGGEGSAPAPFELYLASMATCSGIYALGFCQARGIPTEGLSLRQSVDIDPETKLPSAVRLEVTLPAGFPEKYRPSILRVVEGCLVKKSVTHPPEFKVALSA